MANYADASTQTVWAVLTKNPHVRPEILYTAPDTTTPPDEMITEEKQTLDTTSSTLQPRLHPATSSLLQRRTGRPELVTRVSVPEELDVEIAPSPPPTKALLSPIPENNRLHAGHTPMRLGFLSPKLGEEADPSKGGLGEDEQIAYKIPDQENRSYTPDEDPALNGALSLPSLPLNPMDGTTEHIVLEALDERLSQLALEQERFSKLRDPPELSVTDSSEETVPARQGQEDSSNIQDAIPPPAQDVSHTADLPSNRSAAVASLTASDHKVEEIDGVRLKKASLNFGVPFGQAPRRRSEPSVPSRNAHDWPSK